jgi:hypothetical protein
VQFISKDQDNEEAEKGDEEQEDENMRDKQDQDEYEDVVCSGKEEANRLACSYSKIEQLIEQYIAW